MKFSKNIKDLNFRHESGQEYIDIVSYARAKVQKHPDLRIYVGCDSQNSKRATTYGVVIAFRYGAKGVHFIFHKEKVKKIRDKWTRLWLEAEFTALVASYLRSNLVPVHEVELDFNRDKTAGSNMLVASSVGYMKGLGFDKVSTKPDEQVAVKAANHIVN